MFEYTPSKFFLQSRYLKAGEYKLCCAVYTDNGAPAITIVSGLKVTINLYQLPAPGHCFIKTWSGNEGILEALQEAGLVGEVIKWHPTGFCQAAEVPMLGELKETFEVLLSPRS